MHGSQSKWDGRRPPPLAICASAWLEQRVRKGPLAIPRHAPSLTASDGLVLQSRGADFRSRSVDGTVEMFFGNPGNRPAPKAGHLTYSLVSKRLSGRLLCAMLLNGTFETCRPAQRMSVSGGKPEVSDGRSK